MMMMIDNDDNNVDDDDNDDDDDDDDDDVAGTHDCTYSFLCPQLSSCLSLTNATV